MYYNMYVTEKVIQQQKEKTEDLTMNDKEMIKATYTKEVLLNIMGSYLKQISRDNGKHPAVVLNDIKNSIQYVLTVNEYDGRYKDEINK